MADNLRDRLSTNVTDFSRLGHGSSHQTVQVINLVEVSHHGTHVGCSFVTRDMDEIRVWVFFCCSQCVVHVTEGCCKDYITIFFHHKTVQEARCICLGYTFHVGCFQPIIFLIDIDTTYIMSVRPTQIADWSNVHKTGFHGVFCHRLFCCLLFGNRFFFHRFSLLSWLSRG